MSKYRDDLDAAQNRIASLEERLSDREREIEELRRKAEAPKPRPRESRPSDGRVRMVLLSLSVIGLTAGFVARHHATERLPSLHSPAIRPLPDIGVPSMFSLPDLPADATPRSRMTPEGREISAALGETLRRPDDCVARHGYTDASLLPKDAARITFDRCEECDCCGPSGEFPPTLLADKSGLNPAAERCSACSAEIGLSRSGISLTGVAPTMQRGLSTNGMKVVQVGFDRPVSVFALRIEPSSLAIAPPDRQRRGTATLIAYDAEGRVADVANTSFEATYAGSVDTVPDFSARARFLSVEACDGATVTRAELRLSERDMTIDSLAVSPPAAAPRP